MRMSPIFMALLYFAMGAAFTYIAAHSAEESLWNFRTILPALIATFNFAVTIRLTITYIKIKKAKK
ncbi:YdiK family protein [Halobacillus ihumii]|uniref:YdiK family protein n=1 Tax=Halobacillus ihumii TaxID=2686092 RepID=UPI0013D31C5F|nr:YdiK family protein [Halobacillus ihumii]